MVNHLGARLVERACLKVFLVLESIVDGMTPLGIVVVFGFHLVWKKSAKIWK